MELLNSMFKQKRDMIKLLFIYTPDIAPVSSKKL